MLRLGRCLSVAKADANSMTETVPLTVVIGPVEDVVAGEIGSCAKVIIVRAQQNIAILSRPDPTRAAIDHVS